MTIQEGLREFYSINHFDEDGGANKTFGWIKVGPISYPIPNPDARKKALYLHDIHHLITGYSTKWIGETAISAWELATGGWGKNFFVWMIIMGAFMIGIIVYPASTFKAFIRGRHCRSVVGLKMSKKDLLQMNINDLKQRVGLIEDPKYKATATDVSQFILWILATLLAYLLPMILGVWAVFRLF